MFTNRTPDGRNNICGIKVKELRKEGIKNLAA
jgi:hypothetical protein